jgi:ribosomal protein S18 acetylase RimI-like enzyme
MNRPDRVLTKLSATEREIGGIPNSSQDIIQAHAAAIETYVEDHVGLLDTGYGTMYFQETLEDWARFDLNRRTSHDASISSGLAIMACNKNKYAPIQKREIMSVPLGFKKYNNEGTTSKIIK